MEHLENFLQLFRIMPAATDPIYFLISAQNIRFFPQRSHDFVQFLNISADVTPSASRSKEAKTLYQSENGSWFYFSSSIIIINGSPAGELARQKSGGWYYLLLSVI